MNKVLMRKTIQPLRIAVHIIRSSNSSSFLKALKQLVISQSPTEEPSNWERTAAGKPCIAFSPVSSTAFTALHPATPYQSNIWFWTGCQPFLPWKDVQSKVTTLYLSILVDRVARSYLEALNMSCSTPIAPPLSPIQNFSHS